MADQAKHIPAVGAGFGGLTFYQTFRDPQATATLAGAQKHHLFQPLLYWDFLLEHEPMLRNNQRMTMQVRNLSRLDDARREAIRRQAAIIRAESENPS